VSSHDFFLPNHPRAPLWQGRALGFPSRCYTPLPTVTLGYLLRGVATVRIFASLMDMGGNVLDVRAPAEWRPSLNENGWCIF
jgi:hypothetical protein